MRKEISKHINKGRQTVLEYALFRGQIEPKPCLDWSPFSTGMQVIQLLAWVSGVSGEKGKDGSEKKISSPLSP